MSPYLSLVRPNLHNFFFLSVRHHNFWLRNIFILMILVNIMEWKDLPYWLSGSIIGGGFLTLISILMSLGHSLRIGILEFVPSMIWLLLMLPGLGGICQGGSSGFIPDCKIGFSEYLISIIVYVVIGAIIGFIVGKIKSKNK